METALDVHKQMCTVCSNETLFTKQAVWTVVTGWSLGDLCSAIIFFAFFFFFLEREAKKKTQGPMLARHA
jgi:hypothetical protein